MINFFSTLIRLTIRGQGRKQTTPLFALYIHTLIKLKKSISLIMPIGNKIDTTWSQIYVDIDKYLLAIICGILCQ